MQYPLLLCTQVYWQGYMPSSQEQNEVIGMVLARAVLSVSLKICQDNGRSHVIKLEVW